MERSLNYTRFFFLIFCTLFFTAYALIHTPQESLLFNVLIGIGGGFAFGCCVIGFDSLFRLLKLATINLVALGLVLGLLLGYLSIQLMDLFIPGTVATEYTASLDALKICLYLLTAYLGIAAVLRSSFESPNLQATAQPSKVKSLLIDLSALHDPRLLDLAMTGVVDSHLLISRPLIQMCTEMGESPDTALRLKGKKCLEHFKKLETLPQLDIRVIDEMGIDASKEITQKLLDLARQHNANILTGEGSRLQQNQYEGVKTIALNHLATALKPQANSGECLTVKIQRYGKEAHQGIGYLDDGTMVVINGGADYIGESIKTQVLSVKHTSSGRIIFTNAIDGVSFPEGGHQTVNSETAVRNYCAL